ncbi:hypothetical protein XENOCAPTIV_007320, partial [Xenoophorus captivus]
LHGAAYGKGIYLSPISSISFGYSGMGKGQHRMPTKDELVQRYNRMNTIPQSRPIQSRFLQSRNLNCIALCEVMVIMALMKGSSAGEKRIKPDFAQFYKQQKGAVFLHGHSSRPTSRFAVAFFAYLTYTPADPQTPAGEQAHTPLSGPRLQRQSVTGVTEKVSGLTGREGVSFELRLCGLLCRLQRPSSQRQRAGQDQGQVCWPRRRDR